MKYFYCSISDLQATGKSRGPKSEYDTPDGLVYLNLDRLDGIRVTTLYDKFTGKALGELTIYCNADSD